MSEKVSSENFNASHVKNNIGILYPTKGMSSACGKKIIVPITKTLNCFVNIHV